MKKLLLLMKKNIVLILAVLCAALAVGGAVAVIRDPYYTAAEPVDYSATIGSTVTADHNAMLAYIDTVADLCDSGNVVDRANYYYDLFLKGNETDLSAFLAAVRAAEENDQTGEDNSAEGGDQTETGMVRYETALASGDTEDIPRYISASSIDTDYGSSSQAYTFTVSLKDKDPVQARRKLRVLVTAFDLEVKNYFPGVTNSISELVDSEEDIPVRADMPVSRIMIIALLAGLLLAAGAVYIAYLADNTVSDRDTLEKITGVKLLARLEDQEAIA